MCSDCMPKARKLYQFDRECFAKFGRIMSWGEYIRLAYLCENEGLKLDSLLEYYLKHGCLC